MLTSPTMPPPIPAAAPAAMPAAAFPPSKDRWQRTVRRFKANLGTFIGIIAYSYVVIAVATAAGTFMFVRMSDSGWMFAGPALTAVLAIVLSLPLPYMHIAASQGAKFGPAFRTGLRRMFPGIWTSIIWGFATMLPAVLIVPAVIMNLRFGLAMHVLVNENVRGTKALVRSRQLVYGRTVNLFFDMIGLTLRALLVYIVIGILASIVAAGFPQEHRETVSSLLIGLGTALLTPFYLAYLQTFYEDCMTLGVPTTPDPKLLRFYRIMAVLGLVPFIALMVLPAALFIRNFSPAVWTNGELVRDGAPDGMNVNGSTTDGGVFVPNSSRDQQRLQDMNALRNALALYFRVNKDYPSTFEQLAPDFLSPVPQDPSAPAQAYLYTKGQLTYRVEFSLEEGALVYAAGKHWMTPQGFDVEALPTPVPPDEVSTSTVQGGEPTATEQPTTPRQPDADGDKLADADEQSMGTDPAKSDTDGDRFSDGYEVYVVKSDPKAADSDGDGFDDFSEVQNGYEPTGPGPLTDERKAQIESDRARFDAR